MENPDQGHLEGWVRPSGPLDRFTRWVAFIGLIGLLFVTLVIMLDIVLRSLFNSPLEGLEDITKYSFAIVVATCFPAGLIQGHNVTIRFLGKAFGGRTYNALEAFGALCTFIFFALIAWQFIVFTSDELANDRTTQTLVLPTGPFWSLITLIICMSAPIQVFVLAVWIRRLGKGSKPGNTNGGV